MSALPLRNAITKDRLYVEHFSGSEDVLLQNLETISLYDIECYYDDNWYYITELFQKGIIKYNKGFAWIIKSSCNTGE